MRMTRVIVNWSDAFIIFFVFSAKLSAHKLLRDGRTWLKLILN